MPKIRRGLPKYVYEEPAGPGKWRLRFRRGNFAYNFQHAVGSTEFELEYALCRKGQRPTEYTGPEHTVAQSGTMNALIEYYYQSHAFTGLRDNTQRDYRCVIEAFRKKYGNTAVADFKHEHIEKILTNRASTPTQANKLLKRLRMLFEIAIRLEWRTANPTNGVKPVRVKRGGFPTWTEADIKLFEEKHPSGSQARLAFALMLYTGARRGDMLKLGRQNMKNGRLTFTAIKNGRTVSVPIHTALAKELDHVPAGQMQFLLTGYGQPFTNDGFGNKMRKWCRDAGLKDRSSHGLRKAIARRLAEARATEEEIAAILGDSVRTAAIYTAEADKGLLAGSGIALINPKKD